MEQAQIDRKSAMEVMLKALAAKPDIVPARSAGADAAHELIDGAEQIALYLADTRKIGEYPPAED